MLTTEELYQLLYHHMGPQYWWPADSKIEIIIGAILVQNTNWRNAEYAIERLQQETNLDPQRISELPLELLQEYIRSSGFYKNKGRAIHGIFQWLEMYDYNYEVIKSKFGDSLRKQLLSLRGIGEETADVLLVYIFEEIEFIPDSYTRRIYQKLGYKDTNTYSQLKRQIRLPGYFTNQDANEFHALLDNFGKNYFNVKSDRRYTFLDEYFIE
ncbi:endonuclease III domain-containing protein [Staphylococcus sp. SQ8-PEA]|uniref:Endonuclease III domain-containing protein n=1 Tax=Staphylococcus marylandisciuri TaxID=2981529 RepID=A0ABT2QSF4_9STAP|nr:endonuclease III domain-containing protein [Staphylococcus marylandisciuri]MCU5746882.1 endonuclease III domain-containing protein [Staphylococcus marylandisciuri]